MSAPPHHPTRAARNGEAIAHGDKFGAQDGGAAAWPSSRVLEADSRFIGASGKVRFFPLALQGGTGSIVTDSGRRPIVDFSASSGVAALGYGNGRISQSIVAEINSLATSCLSTVANFQSARLAERLCELMPGEFSKKVIFGATGSEVADYAITLAKAYTRRSIVVAFSNSYHGATRGSAAVSGHHAFDSRRDAETVLFPFPTSADPEQASRTLSQLGAYLAANHAETAAIIIEPIQSDGGIQVPPRGFLYDLDALRKTFNTLLIVDEVKTGLGRTGSVLRSATEGMEPDAILLGKALGGGLPLSAVVGRAELLDLPVLCVSSLGGTNVVCAAANAALDETSSEQLLRRVRRQGESLVDLLRRQLTAKVVRDIRGAGLMVGVQVAALPELDLTSAQVASGVCLRAFELGLLITCSGSDNDVLEITPPLTIADAEMRRGVEVLANACSDVAAGLVDSDYIGAFTGWAV